MKWVDFRDNAVQGILITLVVLIIGLAISKTQDLLAIHELLYAAILVGITVVTSGAVAISISNRLVQAWNDTSRDLLTATARLDERFNIVATLTKADWLISNNRLMDIEASVEAAEVWIITGSLEEEISDTLYAPIIQKNISRGVKYRYFVRDDAVLRNRASVMASRFTPKKGIEFHFVNDPMFNIVCMQDMAIYLPKGSGKFTAYMNLPIRERGSDHFILLGDTQAEALVAHLRECVKEVKRAAGAGNK